MPVTVVLPVLNEEKNLADALQSVAFADEIIVVDSGSSDGTPAVAEAHGARVVQFDFQPGGPKKKAWALANIAFANEWTLFLDGDERVPPGLAAEIRDAVLAGEHDGLYIDREMIFLGKPLRSYRPDWNLRLFRHAKTVMEDLGLHDLAGTGDNEIHEHFKVEGTMGFLKTPLDHRDYRGIGPWTDRHNRYATWEAHLYFKLRREPLALSWKELSDPVRRNRAIRRLWARAPGRPLIRTLGWLIGKRSIRDGRTGWRYAVLMGWYEMLIGLRLEELEEAERSRSQ